MKLTIILLVLTTCSAQQYRTGRINSGRYYFGKNPPKLTSQRPRNSVAYTGSNPPLERVKNTYNLENLNSIRRASTFGTTTTTTAPTPTPLRKKLRIVIKRKGNHHPRSYQDRRRNQNQIARYKIQDTGSKEKYRLVDHFVEQNKDSVLQIKESENWREDKAGEASFDRSNIGKYTPVFNVNVQYRHETTEQYQETKAAENLEDNRDVRGSARGAKKYKLEEQPGEKPEEQPKEHSALEPSRIEPEQQEDDVQKYNTETSSTNSFDGYGSDDVEYGLSQDLAPPWEPDPAELHSEKMKCSGRYLGPGPAGEVYDDKRSEILRKVQMLDGGGGYHFEYKTENQICGEERRTPVNNPNESESSKGYYQYTGPDNVVYRVDYRAGKEGFVPVAAHLPTPPPIPLAILRALQYQENHRHNQQSSA